MAQKPMGIIKRIRKYINEGYEVILRKESDGVHPVSFSRLTAIDDRYVRRTPFEAESVSETYEYTVGKYSIKHIEENERVTFFGKGKQIATTDPAGCLCEEDDDEDCCHEPTNYCDGEEARDALVQELQQLEAEIRTPKKKEQRVFLKKITL